MSSVPWSRSVRSEPALAMVESLPSISYTRVDARLWRWLAEPCVWEHLLLRRPHQRQAAVGATPKLCEHAEVLFYVACERRTARIDCGCAPISAHGSPTAATLAAIVRSVNDCGPTSPRSISSQVQGAD